MIFGFIFFKLKAFIYYTNDILSEIRTEKINFNFFININDNDIEIENVYFVSKGNQLIL